jgi:endogenous inhibitor of DNA gyrase (YacG/DUF329 family)
MTPVCSRECVLVLSSRVYLPESGMTPVCSRECVLVLISRVYLPESGMTPVCSRECVLVLVPVCLVLMVMGMVLVVS